jgi:uncharacterized protein (TIGR02145 family)
MNYTISFIFLIMFFVGFSQKNNKTIIELNINLNTKDSLYRIEAKKTDSLLTINTRLSLQNDSLKNQITRFQFENSLIPVGEQMWCKNNLKVKELNDGTPIFYANTLEKWDSAFNGKIPAYCIHKSDTLGSFGYLYNIYAINSGKLAPKGLRIPNTKDAEALIQFTNAINDGKGAILLKSNVSFSDGLPLWKEKGQDVFKMNIRPLGFRLNDRNEWYIGNKVYFWCQGNSTKIFHALVITEINEEPFLMEKDLELQNSNYGLYVRCIK